MGKKVSQAPSLKISKNEKQLHSLIKVLRPKVYITDSSSFKKLVQELTGNLSSITSPPPTKPDVANNFPFADTKDRDEPESSIEASFASLDSSELCHQVTLSEEFNRVWNHMNLNDSTLEHLTVEPPLDLLAYGDLESWLLEIEPYHFYNDHAQIEQEVSIYDYELSGLI